jgi:hypothetical protein
MVEVIGWKDPIGEGLYDMGVTDKRIVRCRDCKHAASYPDGHEYREPFFCVFHDMDVKPQNFCSWGVQRKEQA